MGNAQHRASKPLAKAPPLTPRHNAIAQAGLRAQAQAAFLANYELTGSIRQAAIDTGIDRLSHYRWLESDPEYADKWETAQEGFTQYLETHAAQRATVGIARGVYFQGIKVGSEQWVSDPLLMFLLKSRRPDVYRERTEISGPNGGPLQVQAVRADSLSRLTDAQLDALAQLNGLAVPALAITAVAGASEPQDLGQTAGEVARQGEDGPARASTTTPAPGPGALDGELLDLDADAQVASAVASPGDSQDESE